MKVLGISAYYHDSAACLVEDGEIISACQEERFTRKKHDPRFPTRAIKYCLEEAKITISDLDAVVFYEKPFLKLERIMETYYNFVPKGFAQFKSAISALLFDKKLYVKDLILNELKSLAFGSEDGKGRRQVVPPLYFSEHHLSHAASAFYPSPFYEAAILTVDGVGEWATGSLGYGRDKEIKIFKELNFPDSVGMLYSAFTYYCGFKVNSGEYKLMGLAPYGNPDSARKYKKIILDNLVDIKDDGSIHLNQEYFDYCVGLKMVDEKKWIKLFGFPPRKPETLITQEYADLALAIQEITEEIVTLMALELKKITGAKNLCMAGGVALNCVANGKLLIKKIFDNIWIQPAAGDAGGALGAALAFYYANEGTERKISEFDSMKGAFLGPAFSRYDILAVISKYKAPYREIQDEDELCRITAELIAKGYIVGWFQGRMEWGPRALGARSILADPRNPEMQKKLNLKIKFREGFRPFAPSVIAEDVKEYFEYGFVSPYMILIDYVHPKRRNPLPENWHSLSISERLYYIRSDIPAVTHLDYSARVQTVHKETNPRYWKLINEFKKLTGYGVVINTSFNVRGEPIVCTPEDAYRCFMRTDIDFLVMENFIFDKKEQPPFKEDFKFELD